MDDRKRLADGKHRLDELANLIPKIYEDNVLGKIPEDVCIDLLQKYTTEQKELNTIVAELEAKQQESRKDEEDIEKFISRLKKYADATELTREMCLELIEYIVVDEYSADRDRHIEIYYKLLDKALEDKTHLNIPQTARSIHVKNLRFTTRCREKVFQKRAGNRDNNINLCLLYNYQPIISTSQLSVISSSVVSMILSI